MAVADSFVDHNAVPADLHGLAIVTLLGRHEFDAAVAALVVVPVDELGDPQTRLFFGGKWFAGVIRSILSTYTVLNRDSEYGVSLETRGRKKDLRTPSSSKRLSSVAARMALPLSAWRISGCCRPLLIRSRRQAWLTRSAAMAGSSRSATSQATTLRLQMSITR